MEDELNAVARSEIQPGWSVFDADGEQIGVVDEVRQTSFSVRTSGVVDATIGIGFDDIESADDGRIELSVSGDDLEASVEGR